MTQAFPNRSWAEINLDILAQNMQEIRRITNPGAEIMAVVKADAYGHGAIQTAMVLLENGATRLAVSMLDEAIELRKHGISAPILILGHTDPRRIPEILAYQITQTVYLTDFARQLSTQAESSGQKVKVHIKVDTGMHRIGYMADEEAFHEILALKELPGLEIEGIFTHFASSDEESQSYVEAQFKDFMTFVQRLEANGLIIPVKHACNSAAILRFPEMHLDMVRAGLIIYGMLPKGNYQPYTPVALQAAMTLKSSIIHVKELPVGAAISYGRHFVTCRPSLIATIPIGYADGYSRRLSDRAEVLINGQRAKISGNICMDMCMLDVTELEPTPKIGDEVVLFGHQKVQGKNFILAIDEISDLLDTINYEITCLVGKRVPRVYLKAGEIVHMHSLIW